MTIAMNHTHHDSRTTKSTERRLLFGVVLNGLITVMQIVGGMAANSLALLSDALHNFSDTLSLVISYFAIKVAGKNASKQKTYGYKRAEIIAALINIVLLLAVGALLLKEAVVRLFEPQLVHGFIMLVVAGVGLVANILTAVMLHRDATQSLNIKSAFLHIVADILSSVAVLGGAIAILLWNQFWIDPLMTLLIAAYIIFYSMSMLKHTIDILMQTTPAHISMDILKSELCKVQYVKDVHHIHIWQLDEANICFEAHVALKKDHLEKMEIIKTQLRERLLHDFGIKHSTLEIEIFSGVGDKDCPCGF